MIHKYTTSFIQIPNVLLKVAYHCLLLLQGKTTTIAKSKQSEESVVRKLMLDSWNQSIFSNIKERLQVIKLPRFTSQLIIIFNYKMI